MLNNHDTHTSVHPEKMLYKTVLFPSCFFYLFPNIDSQTELSQNSCKRKHNFSHFEIAVWQPAITLQIPDWRGNYGNPFQNTPATQKGKKELYLPLSLLIQLLTLHC